MSRLRSFKDALQASTQILNSSTKLLKKGVIPAEVEVLVTASYRLATGVSLSRLDLYSKINDPFPLAAAERLTEWSEMRVQGKPLQHITGTQCFLGHEYDVGPDVLVPRPETEVLVTAAIDKLSYPFETPKFGLELGIGSGVISIELLSRFSGSSSGLNPGLNMIASELSEAARIRSLKNAERILGREGSRRLTVIPAEHPEQVWEPFLQLKARSLADFMITNPPYLASREEVDSDVLDFEPDCALFAPNGDPLFFYRRVAERVREFVRPGGFVFAEMPHERADQIVKIFIKSHLQARALLDLNQRKRVIIAELE